MTTETSTEITNYVHELYYKHPDLSDYIMDIRRLTESAMVHYPSIQCRENTILVAIKYLIDAKKARQIPRGRSRERVSAAFVYVSIRQHVPKQYWEYTKTTLKERTNSIRSDSFENTVSDVECFLRDKNLNPTFKIKSAFRCSKDEIKALKLSRQLEKSILIL